MRTSSKSAGSAADKPPKENHRIRVAREKRERMRSHLMDSLKAVYRPDRDGSSVVVDDVIRHAAVSRGTFYLYFDSLEHAVAECGSELAVEMTEGILALHTTIADPVQRVSTGLMTFLMRAWMDPNWGAFLSHIGLLTGDNLMIRQMEQDVRMGMETGDFNVPNPGVATHIIVGAKIEAMRRIIIGDRDLDYVKTIVRLVVQGLGVAPFRAETQVEKAHLNLLRHGPVHLGWWKMPDPAEG